MASGVSGYPTIRFLMAIRYSMAMMCSMAIMHRA
jgi:hypothetical protein